MEKSGRAGDKGMGSGREGYRRREALSAPTLLARVPQK